MKLVSIDPGVHHCGLAIWEFGALIWAGLVKGEHKDRPWLLADELNNVLDSFNCSPDHVVIEKPGTVGGRAIRGDTNDLIALGITVGGILFTLDVSGCCTIDLVTPSQWKGQLPKDKSQARSIGKLSSDEISRIEVPKNKARATDVWDAVGIGLWTLKR